MPTNSYIENGVLYEMSGLLLTLRGMRDLEFVKTVTVNRINAHITNQNTVEPNLEDHAQWVVDRIMSLVLTAPHQEKLEIRTKVLNLTRQPAVGVQDELH
uniref:Uncharacterized protein n=1 Tax=viral metagenome TaxID=1070528 RepID=A0A6C0KWW6_9ZZZZ